MQSIQTIGIDLRLKALLWQDATGNTWLSYNDPSWLAKRHGLGHEVETTVIAMAAALNAATTSPQWLTAPGIIAGTTHVGIQTCDRKICQRSLPEGHSHTHGARARMKGIEAQWPYGRIDSTAGPHRD
jgi:hypothetical protein